MPLSIPTGLNVVGAPTAGQIAQFNGSAWVPVSNIANTSYSTTLPASPYDGQSATLVDSTSAPTYAWMFQYSSAASKWIFVGGSPGFSEVTAQESTASGTYVALSTPGPSFTIPRAGDYIVEIGAQCQVYTNSTWMSYDIGGTGAVDADAIFTQSGTGWSTGGFIAQSRSRKKSGLAASTALVAKYKSSGGTSLNWTNRWMRVTPITVT